MLLDFVILQIRKGLGNWLVPTISVKPGSSAVYRLQKSLMRLASARRSIYFWENDHVDHGMRI